MLVLDNLVRSVVQVSIHIRSSVYTVHCMLVLDNLVRSAVQVFILDLVCTLYTVCLYWTTLLDLLYRYSY